MPGQICAVSSCKSNRTAFKKKGINIAFHSFSRGNDLVSSTIRNEWIKRCTRKDKFNLKTSKICSLHFKPSDYERDLKNELLGLRLRRILKKNAVPTLNLNDKCEELSEKSIEDRSHKITGKKKNKNLVESSQIDTSLSNPESCQLLDIPSTSTAAPSSYIRVLNNRNAVSILKKNVVPTLNLNEKYEELSEKSIEDISHKIAGKKKNKNLMESSQTDTNFGNPESSQLLDVPSTSTAVPSSYIEVLDNRNTLSIPDTYKEKYENLLLKYNQFKYKSYKKIRLLNSMRKHYKMKYHQSINKIAKSVMAETALKYDACQVLDLLLTVKKEKS